MATSYDHDNFGWAMGTLIVAIVCAAIAVPILVGITTRHDSTARFVNEETALCRGVPDVPNCLIAVRLRHVARP